MMNRVFLFFVVLLLLSCNNSGIEDYKKDSETCHSSPEAKGIMHDGENREYLLYLPDSYNVSSPIPLLFNFHGFGDSASNHMINADMRALAESDTFILVYPQGSCSEGSPHWNPCPIDVDNKSTADDLGFVEAMIDEISSKHNVDMERIYAAGYSNGGMMAYGLANYKSDLIAAIASVSGAMLDCTGFTSHPMPVVHLHGTSDYVIPYEGGDNYSAAQNTLDYWIDFNNTSTNPTVSFDNSGGMPIEYYVYGQGENAVSVEHYKYIGGDHVWFNNTYQGQNTATLIWNFLSKYDIKGLR